MASESLGELRERVARDSRGLTVLSWNVLADAYVRPDYFPNTPPAILDPGPRRAAVLDRLESHGAGGVDVFCLQEIEPPVFAAAATRLAAFAGHFAQKRHKPDGCAVFVRRSLGVSSFRELVYGDGTGHVAVAALARGVSIASTHLKWQSPDVAPEDRLGRAELAELIARWLRPGESWVVCGDLNAEAATPVLDVAFAHGLRDAYESLPDAHTANANGRRKRIDFILHTADLVAAPAPLRPIIDATPLPSGDEPSDHLAVRAELRPR